VIECNAAGKKAQTFGLSSSSASISFGTRYIVFLQLFEKCASKRRETLFPSGVSWLNHVKKTPMLLTRFGSRQVPGR
jgi:hypothetical protein